MALPAPEIGLVIRYAYLWHREAVQGREDGRKDRPCAIVLSMRQTDSEPVVYVAPITHSPPQPGMEVIEIPSSVKRRLGLDSEQSWIVTTEYNRFIWPGPDVRKIDPHKKGIVYGYLPEQLIEEVIAAIRLNLKSGTAKTVARTE